MLGKGSHWRSGLSFLSLSSVEFDPLLISKPGPAQDACPHGHHGSKDTVGASNGRNSCVVSWAKQGVRSIIEDAKFAFCCRRPHNLA